MKIALWVLGGICAALAFFTGAVVAMAKVGEDYGYPA